MNDDLNKIHSLIHSCSETNIKLAFSLANSIGIHEEEVIKPWQDLFRYRTTYTSRPKGANLEEKLINILSTNEIYARDYALLTVPKNIHLLKNLEFLFFNENLLKDFPVPPDSFISLRSLFLEENCFSSFPNQLSKIIQLRVLVLNKNEIESIPKEISDFSNLKDLYLNSNCISEIHENIGHNKELERIYLNDNYLTSLPDSFCDLQITVCCLSDNKISSLPENIGKMTSLMILELNGNPITDKEKERLKGVLPQCSIKFE